MKILDGTIDITPLLVAQKQLSTALQTAKSPLEITGTIKCFEYCYELSWKTMRKILEKMGLVNINSPRTTFTAAFNNGLITNLDTWIHFIELRNLTVHTYDSDLAEDVFFKLPQFEQHLISFISTIKKR